MVLVEEVTAELGDALQQVEDDLRRVLSEASPLTREIGLYLAEGGGKRVRPMMTLLAGRVFTSDLEPVVPIATAAELIHMATLIHDDVIDGAATRRGRPTINERWGNMVAVLTGDVLLARALVHLVDRGTPEIVKIMADMIALTCEGEITQNLSLNDVDQSEEDYFERIEKKTALFFAACCQSGGRMAGATKEQGEALYRFGRHLGMAFQVIDDVLDVTSDAGVMGKPVGSDLASGVLTLPVLYGLQHDTPDGERLRTLLSRPPLSQEQVNEALAIAQRNGALEYAYEVAERFAQMALEELKALPEGRGRTLLEAVVGASLERRY